MRKQRDTALPKDAATEKGPVPVQGFGLDAEAYRSGANEKTSRNGAVVFQVAVFAAAFALVVALWLAACGSIGLEAIVAALVIAALLASSTHIALEWEKTAVLRLGRLNRIAGPGLFFTIPIIESCTLRIDQRIIATPFGAEQTLTSDLVPINVDAVLFWMVWDPKQACAEVEDYRFAVTLSAQTTLRDAIGQESAASLAIQRNLLDARLQKSIEEKVSPWGVTVISVEIRDLLIPEKLQETMSIEAQAERRKVARISLMEAERDIAEMLDEVGETYRDNDKALQLRMMHLLYESIRETGGTVVIPSSFSEGFTGGTDALKDALQ